MLVNNSKIANWWEETKDRKILCTLCPRYCTIGNEQVGFCNIRKNINGKLYSVGYGRPTGFAIDPIEKKPLNHFYPGSSILSFGTVGCNLGCKFCQNYFTSKAKIEDVQTKFTSPEDVISIAKKNRIPSIAFTYNDPVIFGEYVIDVSKLAHEENIKTVMVTAGYVDKHAREDVFKYIDAANVDLKAFSEEFYHKLTYSHLNDVLDTLVWIKKETCIWLEVTTLLIPDENDSEDEIKKMIDWILSNLGDDVPLHFSAFHPSYKMLNKPKTSSETLYNARNIALTSGIKFCYTGNIHNVDSQSTFCPSCNQMIIKRDWHSVIFNYIVNGKCNFCAEKIPGVF